MKIKLLVVGILLVAGLLRFWQLGSQPASLTWDEVAWGYNAYSLGLDGKDEFGRFLPLDYLESFGDYKPPVYAYLDVIPVKLFGLNEFAVRFPSAALGTLSVLIVFFLTRNLFRNDKNKNLYGVFASLFLSVSPWHIMLSRAAFEANVAMLFTLCEVWFFLLWTQTNKSWLFFLSLLLCIISLYTFNSARVVSPLLFVVMCIGFWKTVWNSKKTILVSGLIGFILLLPAIHFFLSPQSKLRYNEVNIFSDVSLVKESNQEIANDKNAFWSKEMHNRRLIYVSAYIQHYLDNLSPLYLFIKGDGNPKFSTQDVGELYLFDLPFLIIGIIFLVRKKTFGWWLILLWPLLAIVPAAVARETPHALRTEGGLPAWYILIAVGFMVTYEYMKRYRRIFLTVALFVLFIFVAYFQHGYWVHYAQEFSSEWQYGYKQALLYARENAPKYTHIVITTKLGRPYIYTLFYNRMSPNEFRTTNIVKRDSFGFVTVEKVGKYVYPVDTIPQLKNSLYIVTPQEVPPHIKILQTFHLANGQPSLVAYEL